MGSAAGFLCVGGWGHVNELGRFGLVSSMQAMST